MRAKKRTVFLLLAACALLAACSRPHFGGPPPLVDDAGLRNSPPPALSSPPPTPSVAPESSASQSPPLSGWVPAGCNAKGSGKLYEVGEGKSLTSLAGVPWAKLQPGDTVRIHARKEPYREKMLLSESGIESAPIRICGVPSPTGELPVIDGDGAITDKALEYAALGHQQRSLILVSLRKSQQWGYKPKYLVIEGLEIRRAADSYSFIDIKGNKVPYTDHAAAIFLERGEHVTVRGCIIHDAGNGFFVASGDSEEAQSRDILFEGNYIYGNGTVGKKFDRHHNIYTEAIGVTFQYNRIGPLREGSGGNTLKDRSSGTVVRYNSIEGGAHLLDLVEPEDSTVIASKDSRFRRTYVYGNLLIAAKASARPIHYGGDNGTESTYRKGTLFFYDNTFVIPAMEKETYNTAIFGLETDGETADIRNNIFLGTGTTHITWASGHGTLNLGVNFTNKTFGKGRVYETGHNETIDGLEKTIVGADPKFAGADFCLAPDSPARGVAGDLSSALPPDFLPKLQYKKHQSFAPRDRFAKGGDLGAFVCP